MTGEDTTGGRRTIDDRPEIMTADQVSELLDLHVASVQKMARSGRIPAHRKPGTRRWWYDRDEIIAWLQSRPTGT